MAKKKPLSDAEKDQVAQYVRGLLCDCYIQFNYTVEWMIGDLTDQIDVDGIDSPTKEQKAIKMRDLLERVDKRKTARTIAEEW